MAEKRFGPTQEGGKRERGVRENGLAGSGGTSKKCTLSPERDGAVKMGEIREVLFARGTG